mmetsp:Transcript_2362/g.6894  ORF Transcript_2362/g.6894 Transcript_2362/m.6894 type:complete len:635 (+) Transcript_2362:104-2008(+)
MGICASKGNDTTKATWGPENDTAPPEGKGKPTTRLLKAARFAKPYDYNPLDEETAELEYRRKDKLEPFQWSDISWIALFLCILKLPMYWPWKYFNKDLRRAYQGHLIHMKMCWLGMEKWAAVSAHIVSVVGLADKNYLGTHNIPHRDLPKHTRVKNRYLSKVYGYDFYVGECDYDSWISLENHINIDAFFEWLNAAYDLPKADGPQFHYDEFIKLLQRTYMRYGIYNGTPLPRDYDHTTEAAAIFWCTTGYGAMFMDRRPDGGYVSDLSHHENFPVRPGFAKYGGALHLSKDLKRVEKLVLHGKEYRPGDREWRGALYVFRSTGVSEAITKEHTLHAHFLWTGMVATLLREMHPNHPLRRFMSPFTINSLSITFGAKVTILGEGAILARNGGYTVEALDDVIRAQTSKWRMETYTEELRRRGMAGLSADAYPWGHFAEKLTAVYDRFISNYMSRYWPTDEAVRKDAGVQNFFKEWNGMFPKMHCPNPPPDKCESREVLKRFMNRFLFVVTAQHEQTGNTAEALMPFDAGFTSIRAGNGLHDLASMQPSKSNRIATQFIQALTSKHAPSLYRSNPRDVHQFFLADCPLSVTEKFMAELWELHGEINEFRQSHGIMIRQMAPPVLDPIDLKIAVTV